MAMHSWKRTTGAALLAALSPAVLTSPSGACHGPGTSGGVQVLTARPLAGGSWEFAFRADHTNFESISAADVESMAPAETGHSHLNVVDRSTLASVGVRYGMTTDLEVGVLFAYYAAGNVGEGETHGDGAFHVHEYGDVRGFADTWFSAKLRLRMSSTADLALVGGIKAPTGADDAEYEGEPIDPALQPGSGSWDASLGLAFTRGFGERFLVDASALHVFRTEAGGYRIGDQTDVGAAVTARLAGDPHGARRLWGSLEAVGRRQEPDVEGGSPHPNSGGTTIFLAPGVHADWSPVVRTSIAVQFPVHQDLNDVQQRLDAKIGVGVTLSI
jgi:hypothetical protein